MTTDGGLDRWGSDGPIVWHSETSGLDYWCADSIFSDYQAAASGGSVLISNKMYGGFAARVMSGGFQ